METQLLTFNFGALSGIVGEAVIAAKSAKRAMRGFARCLDRLVHLSRRGMRRRERRLQRARDNRRAAWVIRETHKDAEFPRGRHSHAEVRRWLGGF